MKRRWFNCLCLLSCGWDIFRSLRGHWGSHCGWAHLWAWCNNKNMIRRSAFRSPFIFLLPYLFICVLFQFPFILASFAFASIAGLHVLSVKIFKTTFMLVFHVYYSSQRAQFTLTGSCSRSVYPVHSYSVSWTIHTRWFSSFSDLSLATGGILPPPFTHTTRNNLSFHSLDRMI